MGVWWDMPASPGVSGLLTGTQLGEDSPWDRGFLPGWVKKQNYIIFQCGFFFSVVWILFVCF